MPEATGPERGAAAVPEAGLPVGVHLVGSVPLASAKEVFARCAEVLGDRLRRMPDGETGARSDWIAWQHPVFSSLPQFEVGPVRPGAYRTLPQIRLQAGLHGAEPTFDDLGYAHAAIASYGVFARLKREGAIPPAVRFQLTLPTPLAPVGAFVSLDDQAALEPLYEQQMLIEVDRVLAAVPAEELAIQWDARYEFAMLEGAVAVWFADVRAGILERLVRLGNHVPPEVELGYHLCYGDDEHGHFVEPADTREMVEVANSVASALDRPLSWIHLPVPADRTDDAYFAPLVGLRLPPGAELHLGLIHSGDGVEGARARIAAAGRHAPVPFGAATECGWGRGGADAVRGLLELHREVSAPLPA
jgi:hypothetical protein